MKTSFRIDDHLVECTSEPLEGTYFEVSWSLRLVNRPLAETPLQAESYVCRASTEQEALDDALARARLMSGLVLGPIATIDRHAPDAGPDMNGDVPPDAPVVSGR